MPADVLLAYLHPDNVSASFHRSLNGLVSHDAAHARRLGQWAAIECASGGIPDGRNDATRTLLESDCDWILFVDADMGFAPDVLDRLLAVADPAERPIVGGLAFAARKLGSDGMGGSRITPQPTIFDFVDYGDGCGPRLTGRTHFPANTVVRCAGTGAAMLLVHRSVMQRMADEFGPTWFDRFPDKSGALLGEDIAFFNRVAALELPVYVHTGARTTHAKTTWIGEADYWAQVTPPPASDECAVIVPVKARLGRAEPFMRSLRASTGLATVYAVCERSDMATSEWAAHGANVVTVPDTVESFPAKVNAAFGETTEPWLLLVGDDVRFHAGWLDHVEWVAEKYDRSVVATNDLANPRTVNGEHATHPAIRRSYVVEVGASWDGPGVICHEGYRHWYVDDEITVAAQSRGVFGAAPGAKVEHLHPMVGKAEMDDVYEIGVKYREVDELLFARRMKVNT